MRKALLLTPLMMLTVVLSGCRFSFASDDSWKKQFGTPSLLLDNSSRHYVYRYAEFSSDDVYEDSQKIIANAIKDSGPIEAIEGKEPTAERYFTYEGYFQHATTGPNYSLLSTFEDGLMVIRHKTSLGSEERLYFSMDPKAASEITDLVFSYIDKK